MPTLSDLRARVRMDELLNSTTVVSNADLNTLLNEGALQLNKDGHAFVATATWSAVASAGTYVLSGASPKVSNFLDVAWDEGGVVYTPTSGTTQTAPNNFRIVSERWLDLHVPGWQDAAASDTLNYVFLSYDSSGNLVLGVSPPSSTTTPTFKLYYINRGADMSADANYPWTNSLTNLTHTEPYHVGIAYYAMWQLHRQKTLLNDRADHYLQLYQLTAKQFRESQRKLFEGQSAGDVLEGQMAASQTFGSL